MIRTGLLTLSLLASTPALAEAAPPAEPPTPGALIGPALNTADLERAKHFYVDGLGMRVAMTMGRPERQETILGFDGDPRKPGIILMYDAAAKSHKPMTHGTGFDRLVLRMADLDATAARLRAAGFTPGPIRDVAMGYRMMMATDPDGYRLELVQSRPKS